jgi:magnesium transporter
MPANALELLLRSLAERHPEDTARALEALAPAEASRLLARLPARTVGQVIERLAPHAAGRILPGLGSERTHRLLAQVTPRQAAAILQHLEAGAREAALAQMPGDAAQKLRDLLAWPAQSAGGMMDPQVSAVSIDLGVGEAITALRKAPRRTLYYLYVTGRDGKLAGVLNMRELLLAGPRDRIEDLVHRDVVAVAASADREEVAELMRGRGFIALPVVDAERRLLGVVKHDDVLEAVEQEAFEDVQKMVGAGADERALSPVSIVVRKRLPWLYVNLATAFAAAAVVGLFEGTIERVTALAVLMPIVAGQGGNTGAQALAVMIRGLALRELGPGAARRVVAKELAAGLVNGLAVAAVTAAAVWLWDGRASLALVIGLAMVVNMAAAGLFGAVIPLVLAALGRDPAQSSSIFLTTVTDCVGFAAFLGFASLFLPLLSS